MRIDWDVWTVDDVGVDANGNRIEARKVVDVETGKAISFVIFGARIEPSTDPDGPSHEAAFDSFTIDGQDPTEEQSDDFYDDLRGIVWDSLTE